jgi:hypothetical protein
VRNKRKEKGEHLEEVQRRFKEEGHRWALSGRKGVGTKRMDRGGH